MNAQERIKILEDALQKIAKWRDFPETGKFWDAEKTRPMSYQTCYGSYGEIDYMRDVARDALKNN